MAQYSPTLTMSLSRARRLEQCERQDWWYTEGARGGYRRDAAPETQQAFALKKLQSLPGLVGIALHEAAAAYAAAVRDGRRPPTYDELHALVRGHLNAGCTSRDVRAWFADPQGRPMLREVLLGEWPGGRIPADVRDRTRVQVGAMLRRLLTHPMTHALHECGRGDIRVCDRLDAMSVECDDHPVQVYAAPDVVYLTGARMEVPGVPVPVPAGTPVIGDYKTGRSGGRVDAARDQLAVYAWYVQERLGLEPGPLGYVARVADLGAVSDDDADVCWLMGPADVARGRRLIEQSVARVVRKLDASGSVPMEATAPNPAACRWCPFTQVCAAAADRGPSSMPAPFDRAAAVTLVRDAVPNRLPAAHATADDPQTGLPPSAATT